MVSSLLSCYAILKDLAQFLMRKKDSLLMIIVCECIKYVCIFAKICTYKHSTYNIYLMIVPKLILLAYCHLSRMTNFILSEKASEVILKRCAYYSTTNTCFCMQNSHIIGLVKTLSLSFKTSVASSFSPQSILSPQACFFVLKFRDS